MLACTQLGIIAWSTRTTGKIDYETFGQMQVLQVYNLHITSFESESRISFKQIRLVTSQPDTIKV